MPSELGDSRREGVLAQPCCGFEVCSGQLFFRDEEVEDLEGRVDVFAIGATRH